MVEPVYQSVHQAQPQLRSRYFRALVLLLSSTSSSNPNIAPRARARGPRHTDVECTGCIVAHAMREANATTDGSTRGLLLFSPRRRFVLFCCLETSPIYYSEHIIPGAYSRTDSIMYLFFSTSACTVTIRRRCLPRPPACSFHIILPNVFTDCRLYGRRYLSRGCYSCHTKEDG